MSQQQAEPKRLAKPVDWEELYPGKFLKAVDLKGRQVTVEISAVDLEELEGDGGKQVKGIISFRGKGKQLALNRTNGVCLKAMFGKKVQDWVGKRVTLMPTETKFGAEMVDAIRIFGSPDIARDLEIEIKLPKKRPIPMTMHRTGGAAGSTPAPRQEPAKPDSAAWCETLKACDTEAKLTMEWERCCVAFGDRPPIECDDAFRNRQEQLAEAAGRQMELGQ